MNRPKKLDLKNLISWGGSKNPAFFDFTGNFVEFSCKVKSPPGRIALRRRGNMSLERPAAGGESCKAGFFLVFYKAGLYMTKKSQYYTLSGIGFSVIKRKMK